MNLATLINDGNTLSDILNKYQNSVILCDQNTETLCLPLLNLNPEIPVISISAGETNKSAFSLNFIWNKLLQANADRNTILINIGGGVITDIGGLAAATYNRGIKFINVPTTLM